MLVFTHFVAKEGVVYTSGVDAERLKLCISLMRHDIPVWGWKNDPLRMTTQMVPGDLDLFLLRLEAPLEHFDVVRGPYPDPSSSTLAYPIRFIEMKEDINQRYGKTVAANFSRSFGITC